MRIYLVLQLPKFSLFLLLRSTLRAGSWVCSCSGSCRLCPGWGTWWEPQERDHDTVLTLCSTKGTGTCGTGQGTGQWGTAGTGESAGRPQTVWVHRLWGCKTQGLLCWGSIPGGTSLSCFCVTAPWLNYFKDPDVWDTRWETQGWADKETLSDCECGVRREPRGAPLRSLEAPTAKRPWSQQLQTGVGTRVAPKWSNRKVSLELCYYMYKKEILS